MAAPVSYAGSQFDSDTAELAADQIMAGSADGHSALDHEEELSSGEEEDAFSDDLSSSPSVPDEDIDFEHVYALHNFMATVEGQASVSKGDSLTLLDDSNSYWWLVRVLKTQAVGYIPAENIETPFERLARLNKHRNVDLSLPSQEDHATGAGSAQMRTRIGNKPLKPRPPKPKPGQVSSENRVMFTAPTYYEHSGDDFSDEYDEEEGEEGVEFEGQDGFDEEDDLEDEEEEEDGDDDTLVEDHRAVSVDQQLSPSLGGDADPEEQQRRRNRAQALGNQMRVQAGQAPVSTSPQAGGQGQLQAQQSAGPPSVLVAGSPPRGPSAVSPAVAAPNMLANRAPTPHSLAVAAQRNPHASVEDEAFLASTSSGSTRKIILTPPVAQEEDLSSQGHDDTMGHAPRKLRKSSREDDTAAAAAAAMAQQSLAPVAVSPASEDDAPKKKGGMFSSLFKKKDKRKDSADSGRSSDETPRSTTPTGGGHLGLQTANLSPSRRLDSASPSPTDPSRPWQPQSPSVLHQHHQQAQQRPRGDAYLADATRRQQQLEAQHVREGSGHRLAPGVSSSPQGTLSPPNLGSAASSPGTPVRPMRPGSLIGSPSMGGDVPVLSVLRVFAGEGIESESTFKTVLLNESTTTPDLVRQAVQRFRLPMEQIESFYLTIRELGSDETPIGTEQMPLEMFERTSERGSTLPSVKRSSVGSISSVSSNLSLNPAIAKLGMGDYSDDSSAKLYLHRRDTVRRAPRETVKATAPASPTLRFALRAVVYPADMPDGVMWDPHANALVLRPGEPNAPQEVREKVLFFPANVNVAEVLETCLDRFGIVGGVVEGGDEVEDKLAKRRSITRVRYSLAAMRNGRQAILSPGSRVLDAYDSAPIFKEHERSSKEFRRRSADAAMILGSTADLQPTDPVFVLRNAALLHGHRSALAAAAADDGPRKQRPQQPVRLATDQSMGESVYATPSEELTTAPLATSPRDAIAAQRAQTRANQRGQMLSAQKNATQGVDIRIADRGTVRSSRTPAGGRNVRYSYIDQDGAEIDISEAVEAEFAGAKSSANALTPRSASSAGSSSSADEFATPQVSPVDYDSHDREEQAAIDALRAAPVTIGMDSSSTIRSREPGATSSRQSNRGDVLEAALASPTPEETLEARINRVLNKVKSGSAGGGVASALRQVRRPSETTGRSSPALGRSSPAMGGRASPAPGVRSASPALTPGRRHATPTRAHHAHQPSDSTIGSESTHGTSPSTPAGSAVTNGTSPATRAGSAVPAQPIAYRDDFGLDVLLALVHDATPAAVPVRPPRQPGVDELFGPQLDANAHKWYPDAAKSLTAIEEVRLRA